MMHELIDQEDPCCLYCRSQLQIESSGEWVANSKVIQEVEKLTCPKCEEHFEIYSIQDDTSETHYESFTFTCKDIAVFYHYTNKNFIIGNHKLLFTSLTDFAFSLIGTNNVPVFEVDFSDKNKLYNKLKIYVLFS